MNEERIKLLNERLKPFIVYWVAIAILIIVLFMMIKDFNRYESELHQYYRDLMTDQNCLPTTVPSGYGLGYAIAENYTCNDPEFRDGYWYCDINNLTKI